MYNDDNNGLIQSFQDGMELIKQSPYVRNQMVRFAGHTASNIKTFKATDHPLFQSPVQTMCGEAKMFKIRDFIIDIIEKRI